MFMCQVYQCRMKRKKIQRPDLNHQRRDNYVFHYDVRQQVKALEPGQIQRLKNIAEVIRPPKLNDYGCDDYSPDEWFQIITLANQSGVLAYMCIKWYHSDKDWENFLVNWKNLPEVPERDVFSIAYGPSTGPVHNS